MYSHLFRSTFAHSLSEFSKVKTHNKTEFLNLKKEKKGLGWPQFYRSLLFVAFVKMGTKMNIHDRKLPSVMPSHTPCRALRVTGA